MTATAAADFQLIVLCAWSRVQTSDRDALAGVGRDREVGDDVRRGHGGARAQFSSAKGYLSRMRVGTISRTEVENLLANRLDA